MNLNYTLQGGRLTSSMQLMLEHNATVLDCSTSDNSNNGSDKGKCFVITKLQAYHKILPNKFTAQPTIEVCLNCF